MWPVFELTYTLFKHEAAGFLEGALISANIHSSIVDPVGWGNTTQHRARNIKDSTGNKFGTLSVSKSPAKSTVLSTSEKGISSSNTPIPAPIPSSSSPSSRNENYCTTSHYIKHQPYQYYTYSFTSFLQEIRLFSITSSKLCSSDMGTNVQNGSRNMLPVADKLERYLEDQPVGGREDSDIR